MLRNWACSQPAMRPVSGGFDPAEEFLVDPGFDNAAVWDSIGTGDVNATFPSELYLHGASASLYQGTAALTRIPPDGTYRLTLPGLDNVVQAPTGATQVQCGKGAITNVAGSIPAATLLAGGTFDFALAGATGRRFGIKINTSAAANCALPGLSLKRIA